MQGRRGGGAPAEGGNGVDRSAEATGFGVRTTERGGEASPL
jgi:hypothetical protein